MEKHNRRILSILLTAFVVLSTQVAQAQFCSVVTQDVQCSGESTGIISFAPTGGTAPYDYMWSHNPVINASEVLDLPAGIYSITITDALGVSEVCSVEIFEPTPITIINVIEVDPMCGLMDGSFDIEAIPQSGGSQSDLMYSIDGGGTFQTSNVFTGLGANDYLIIVADISGCFIVDSRQLVDATSVVVNLNSAMCQPGGTIDIDIDVSGGTLPYTYNWSNGAFTEDLLGAPQGTYSVTVTDREGCSAMDTYTVDNCCDVSMFCDGQIQEISCNNGADGSITAMPSGGSGVYTYLWSNGVTTATNSNLSAGFYNVTITDDTACQSVCGFDLVNPTAILITELITSNPNCGGSDGAITISATPQSNGTLAGLMYSIDGVNFQASNAFTGLSAGSYNVTVSDDNGCSASITANLMDTSGLSINLVDSFCEAGSTVSISVVGAGGQGPYQYTWTSTQGFSGTGETISGAPQGTYTATVADANGCTASITVTQDNCCDPTMFCLSSSTDPTCSTPGSITITPSGGVGPFSYMWSHDATLNNALASNLSAGFYNVTINDSAGCSAVCGIQLAAVGAISIDDVQAVEPLCGLATGSITINATPKSGSGCNDLEYSIDGGMNYQISNQFPNLNSGDYLVMVRDCDACSAAASQQLMNVGGVGLSFTTACANGIVDIDVTPMNGTAPYTYAWTGPNGFTSTDEDVIGGVNGDYTVIVTDDAGCSDQMTIVEDIACFTSGNIQGFVWEDIDGDGIYDENGGGVSNIPVSLFNTNGVLVSVVFTDATGMYFFEGQDNGQYILHFGPPIEYSFTLPNVGDDSQDSDVTGANGTGTTSIINYNGGDRYFDAGIHLCVPVGELVWFDLNENDQWDANENGINGLEVRVYKEGLSPGFYLYDYTHTGPKPGTPSDDGYYKFCLPPGTYYLEYVIPPFGLVPVRPGVGGSDNDSDITGANGPNTTNTFSILSGEEKCDLGAGYYPMATLGNRIFLDDNSNGLADTEEFGMSDVMVELYEANTGEMIDSQLTEADGSYLFDYLQKDDYFLKVVPPDNYIVTIANAGNDDEMDSDVDNSNGLNTTPLYSLTPGMEINNVDIGLVEASVVAVDFVSFSGENRGAYNQLEWSVGFQYNTDYFEVERRTPEESSFSALDRIESSNVISLADYEYQDADIDGLSLVYYRITEVDLNGNRLHSDVISIDIRPTSREAKITIGPNPFRTDLTVEIDVAISSQATITFWDASGRSIDIEGINERALSPGINTVTFDWSGIPVGVYTAQVLVDNSQFIQKLIKIE